MDVSDPDSDDAGGSPPDGDTTDTDADTAQSGNDAETGEHSDTPREGRGDSGDGSTDTGSESTGIGKEEGEEGEEEVEDIPEPTPQSAALRRQQQYVGIGGAFVAGVAFGVGTLQRFPDTPVLAAVAGLTGTALVLWLVRRSIFPGESAV